MVLVMERKTLRHKFRIDGKRSWSTYRNRDFEAPKPDVVPPYILEDAWKELLVGSVHTIGIGHPR
jgi:hypothetical protein